MGFSVMGMPPLFPDIALDLDAGPDALGFAVGASSLVAIFFQIPMGLAADRIGIRPMLVGGLVAIVLACASRAIAPNLLSFGLSQAVLGVAVPAFQAGSLTGLAHTLRGPRLATGIAYCFSAFNVGLVISAGVVGALGTAIGWRGTLVVLALLPALVLPVALRVAVPERPAPTDVGAKELAVRALRFLTLRRPLTLAATATLTVWCMFVNTFTLPFALREQGIDAAGTGLLLTASIVGGIASGPILSRLAGWRSMTDVLLGAFALAGVSIVVLAAFGPEPAIVVVTYFGLGLSLGGVTALLQGDASGYAADAGVGHGAALAAMRLASSTGAGFGPTMAGAVYVAAGFLGAQVAGAVFLVFSTLLVLSLRRLPEPAAVPVT